jgi:hypothetical protein
MTSRIIQTEINLICRSAADNIDRGLNKKFINVSSILLYFRALLDLSWYRKEKDWVNKILSE